MNAPSKFAVVEVAVGEKGAHLYATDDIEFYATKDDAEKALAKNCEHCPHAMYALLEVKTVAKAKPITVEAVF